jgi:hypothetical protein
MENFGEKPTRIENKTSNSQQAPQCASAKKWVLVCIQIGRDLSGVVYPFLVERATTNRRVVLLISLRFTAIGRLPHATRTHCAASFKRPRQLQCAWRGC